MSVFTTPAAGECAPYFLTYITAVEGHDALEALVAQAPWFNVLQGLPAATAGHRYAEGKWSVREVVGHITDTERIVSYRVLRIARGDTTPLPGFDENLYVSTGGFEQRALADIVAEWRAVRASTLLLLRSLTPEAAARSGMSNGHPTTARALAWVVAGHAAHHARLLRERYGVAL